MKNSRSPQRARDASASISHLNCPSRKDIELSPSGLPRRAGPPSENSKTLLPFPEMQSSRVAFHSPQLRRLRCALHSDNARSLRYAEISSRDRLCVNRAPILWLATRRKGIARSAVLHLDCARFAKKTARIDSRGNSVNGLPRRFQRKKCTLLGNDCRANADRGPRV